MELLKVTPDTIAPLQTTWLPIASTVAVGFIVILNDCVLPKQLTPPFVNVGVAITVAVTGSVPILIPVS